MATGSTLAYPLDDEMGDAVGLHLPCPLQTARSGDRGGRIVEDGGLSGIDSEEAAELSVGEAGYRRLGAIDGEVSVFDLRAERAQVRQHGVKELAGIPRAGIAPATSEGRADGRRPLGRGRTA